MSKMCPHGLNESLKISQDSKIERDLLETNGDIAP